MWRIVSEMLHSAHCSSTSGPALVGNSIRLIMLFTWILITTNWRDTLSVPRLILERSLLKQSSFYNGHFYTDLSAISIEGLWSIFKIRHAIFIYAEG